MNKSKAFSLKNGRKVTWFDCHRQFLPCNHVFRRNKEAFYKNRIENDYPPQRLSGEQVYEMVSSIPKSTEVRICNVIGHGHSHNWTKRSIFWDFPYWKNNLLRHNLDVMHIEKNVFENVIHTILDSKEKTKDNENARLDLAMYCHRKELLLKTNPNGKCMKPKANFCLSNEQIVFIEFLMSLFSLSTFHLQDKFEQRKSELTSQSNMENANDGEQSIHENPSDWDIWIDSVGKKKGRVFGLGSVGRMFISTSSQQLHFEEVDALRSQIQALNESLQRQEEEKVKMKRELQKQRKDKIEMRKELTKTKNQVITLMQHLGYLASSSHQSLSSPHTNENEDDDDSDHTEDGDNYYFILYLLY